MTIFINIIIVLVSIYVVIWIYLLIAYLATQWRAYQDFLDSWQNNTYAIEKSRYRNDTKNSFIIKYPARLKERCIEVNFDGGIIGGFQWYDDGKRDGNKKEPSKLKASINKAINPTRRMRRQVEDISKQIVTMGKLENNWSSNDSGFGEPDQNVASAV